MIIVAGGTKGGSGQTTVATNLAIMRAPSGRDVVLIDSDDQETSTDFIALRSERNGEAQAQIRRCDYRRRRARGVRKSSAITAKLRKAQIARVIGKDAAPANGAASADAALVNLRIPSDQLARIDQTVSSRSPKTSRHYWLLEAILEKLEREGQKLAFD